MGGGASVPAAASSQDVAAQVALLGEPYEPYAKKIDSDGVDGAFLASITNDDLPSLFMDLGVSSAIHKKKLELIFQSFKSNELPSDGIAMPVGEAGGAGGAAEAKEEASGGVDMDMSAKLKAFAAFLSHFKLECGTEARLVQQNLKAIIKSNPLEGSTTDM